MPFLPTQDLSVPIVQQVQDLVDLLATCHEEHLMQRLLQERFMGFPRKDLGYGASLALFFAGGNNGRNPVNLTSEHQEVKVLIDVFISSSRNQEKKATVTAKPLHDGTLQVYVSSHFELTDRVRKAVVDCIRPVIIEVLGDPSTAIGKAYWKQAQDEVERSAAVSALASTLRSIEWEVTAAGKNIDKVREYVVRTTEDDE